MARSKRDRLIDELTARFRTTLDKHLPENPEQAGTLDEIEDLVHQIGTEALDGVEERIVEVQEVPAGNHEACPRCLQPARFKRSYPRKVLTRHGSRLLACRYHYCQPCQHGFLPLERRLGLNGSGMTSRVVSWIARLGAKEAFEEARASLLDLQGLEISESTIERVTVAVGRRILKAEASAAPTEARKPLKGAKRAYGSFDGTMTPLRNPWKRDQSLGKLKCRWGECKVAVIYRPHQGKNGDERVAWRCFTATMGDVNEFRPMVEQLANSSGAYEVEELIILADGAPWIWRMCRELFPHAVLILDYWHATQHLYAVAEARFGKGTVAAKEWVHTCQADLDKDDVDAVLRTIANWDPRTKKQRETKEREYAFLERNRERMSYGTFRKAGCHVGSGVMEASCRQVVAQRLHEAGMHWREETAQAVVAVRARMLSTETRNLRPLCTAGYA